MPLTETPEHRAARESWEASLAWPPAHTALQSLEQHQLVKARWDALCALEARESKALKRQRGG